MTATTSDPQENADFASAAYWDRRYRRGGTSGAGSYGSLADYKTGFLNTFCSEHGVQSIVDLGCGDGNQAMGLKVPAYLGIDVSPRAVELCRARLAGQPNRRVVTLDQARDLQPPAELALSLDVIYHLTEDPVFDDYMRLLTALASRWFIVYASDHDALTDAPHVRHRAYSRWIAQNAPGWRLMERVENPFDYAHVSDRDRGTFAYFQVFGRTSPAVRDGGPAGDAGDTDG